MPPRPRPAVVLRTPDVEVRFEWQGDRWRHSIEGPRSPGRGWRSEDEDSTDGGGDPRWPPSPVFVELHRVGSGNDAPVMAVGQAGRSHFSAVVAPDPERPGAIRFEIAARLHEVPQRLGSTYEGYDAWNARGGARRRVEPLDLDDASLPRTVRWAYRVGPDGFEPLADARLAAVAGDGRRPPSPRPASS